MLIRPIALVLLATTGCAAPTPVPETPAEAALVLDGLTLVDMTGAAPRPAMSILICAGRIADLYPSGSRSAPRGARVLDLSGRYAIPGLIDAHVHLTAPFTRTTQQDSLARFFLEGGITSMRDMAGNGAVLRDRARLARNGESASPRIFYSTHVAGPIFYATDRRVSAITNEGTPGRLPWSRIVTADSDAVAAANGALEIGATGVKAYAELSPALLRAVVREAHSRGVKVWSHAAVVPAKPSDAVAAGVDVLSHASMLVLEMRDSLPGTYSAAIDLMTYETSPSTPQLAALFAQMQRQGTMLDATLLATRRMERGRAVTEGDLQHMRGVDAWSVEATRLAYRAGVRLVAGTDYSGYPGRDALPTMHDELAIYVDELGMTPLEALATATTNGAEMLGMQRELGTIEKGKLADLVILDGDPLASIRNTRRLVLVIKNGVVHQVPTLAARDSLDWRPSWPGTQMAVVKGDPYSRGPFVFRFRMPSGYWIHPHSHPLTARIRVVAGTFLVGMGNTLDSLAARTLGTGEEIRVEPGMVHFEGARGATEIEVSGEGPWGVTFIDPTRDPARRSQ